MNNEARLWKVEWSKQKRGYLVVVKDEPNLAASAKTLDEAIDKLEERLAQEREDPVPHFEWLTPLPHPVGVEGRDFVSVLCGHDRVDVPDIERLVEKPRCQHCHNYSTRRTAEPIRLERLPDGDLPFTQFGGQLCSEPLARFLNLNNCSDIKLLPTIIAGKETTKLVEVCCVVPREFVAKHGASSAHSFCCGACGVTSIVYLPGEANYFQYVARSSLPNPLPRVFAAGSDCSVRLAVTKALRQQVTASDQFKKVVSRKIGLLSDELSVPANLFFRGKKI